MFRVLVLMLTLCLASPLWAAPQDVTLSDGRFYRIDLPARPKGAPMIVALHGGGGNPDQFARNSGLSAAALAQGYCVIYPAGTARGPGRLYTWNGGYCCGQAARAGVDDVAFLDAVIADAARRFGLDASRVYMTGMSNGSLMAERYAAAHPERLKAVAGVSGTLDLSFPVTGPVPLLHIHGTRDDRVPYAGGVGSKGRTGTVFSPVDRVIAAFVAAQSGPLSETQRVIDPVQDGTRVIERDWRRPDGAVGVRLLTVEGGGHVWPGGARADRGGGTQDIRATDEVLRFFAEHP